MMKIDSKKGNNSKVDYPFKTNRGSGLKKGAEPTYLERPGGSLVKSVKNYRFNLTKEIDLTEGEREETIERHKNQFQEVYGGPGQNPSSLKTDVAQNLKCLFKNWPRSHLLKDETGFNTDLKDLQNKKNGYSKDTDESPNEGQKLKGGKKQKGEIQQFITQENQIKESQGEMGLLRYLTGCEDNLYNKKQDPVEKNELFKAMIYQEIRFLRPLEILYFSTKSQEDSKRVQIYLKTYNYEYIDELIEEFKLRIGYVIIHNHACYILRTLLDYSTSLVAATTKFSVQNMSGLVSDKNAVVVLQHLAELSPEFCRFGLQFFEAHFDSIINIADCAAILNKIISFTPSEDDIFFLLERIESCQMNKNQGQVLRVLSNLVQRFTGANLKKLHLILEPHIHWLINDKFGNFAVLNIVKKNDVSLNSKIVFLLIYDPIGSLVRRVRMLALIEALKCSNSFQVSRKLLEILNPKLKGAEKLFCTQASCYLMLAVLFSARGSSAFAKFKSELPIYKAIGMNRETAGNIRFFTQELLQLELQLL